MYGLSMNKIMSTGKMPASMPCKSDRHHSHVSLLTHTDNGNANITQLLYKYSNSVKLLDLSTACCIYQYKLDIHW